jgi:hypothetical protein
VATRKRATRLAQGTSDGVWIQPEGRAAIPLKAVDAMPRLAWQWNYRLHNRSRWTNREEALARQRDEVSKLVTQLGLTPDKLASIAEAGLIEVSVPWRGEDKDWALRILPWEYVLAAATRDHRRGQGGDFAVVRHLRRAATRRPLPKPVFMYVQSAPPGVVATSFDFRDEERHAVEAASALGLQFHALKNPDLEALRNAVERFAPRLIHVAGVDLHQGRQLRGGEPPQTNVAHPVREDGIVMLDPQGAETEVSAADLARALCAGRARPDLICLNLHNSASRMAALSVALGAGAAIGFQDSFDDALGERFYSTLYRSLSLSDWDLAASFCFAWAQIRDSGRPLTGTGLVLWSGSEVAGAEAREASTARVVAIIKDKWTTSSRRVVTVESAAADLSVAVEEVPELNYSMLHNGRPLFRSFRIDKRDPGIGEVQGIDVDVTLHLGGDSASFRQRVSIPATANGIDIAHRVRVSLAGSLGRALRESLRTSLLVEVRFGEAVLFRETRWVSLLAVDEWEDSDTNRKWLPSFVLPRDPSVAQVIDRAQRYLQALCDDPTQGFDGYQSIQDANDGPDCAGVDRQVQAIWCALLYETPLAYINPPPTFTDASQRLRTPSDVILGGRGTCIDLALLLAACLEYVDIYPTVVLLQDHAFPCYWRSHQAFEDFALARSESVGHSGGDAQDGLVGANQIDSWCFLRDHYREVMGEIASGRLVAIESTGLCWRHSFARACEQGHANLARRSRFDSMLDIRAARIDRNARVTPLPLLRMEASR